MSYHNLSNEEIVFLFFVSKSIKEQYEEAYNQQVVEQKIPTEFGYMNVETIIPDEVREEMLKSKHYTYMKSIYEKLLPIYEVIRDVETESTEEIENVFKNKKP